MSDEEIKRLLTQIKVFYPRFDAVEKDGNRYGIMKETVTAWHRVIGWMDLDQALKILDDYMASEQGGRTPNINLWSRGGKMQAKAAWHSARLDRQRGLIIWQPEGGPVFEKKTTYNTRLGAWEDDDGYLWGEPGGE